MGITLSIIEIPFTNQFNNIRYSHEDYKQFAIELRGALTSNAALSGTTAGQRDALSDALDQYLADVGSSKAAEAYQKGSTAGEGEAWETVLKEVRRKEGTLRGVHDKGSSTYLLFFPNGLTVYNQAKKGDRVDLLDNLILRFGQHDTSFPGAAASLTSIKTAYLQAANTQAEAKGSKQGGRSQRDLSRLALANNMFEIWLTIASANQGNPSVAKVFFNTSIFDKGSNSNNDGLGLLLARITNMADAPLINASVAIFDQNGQRLESGITDDEGYYKSQPLPIGFYDLTASHPGYVERTRQFQVFDNNDPLNLVELPTA